MEKTCFLFGHRDIPQVIQKKLEKEIGYLYLEHGIRHFYVGNRGDFDGMAASAIRSEKKKYNDICLYLVTPYHPAERSLETPHEFDGIFFPDGIEAVPRQFAIVRTNRYMVQTADSIICYVNHIGNARALWELAQKRKEREHIYAQNLAETNLSAHNFGDHTCLLHPLE